MALWLCPLLLLAAPAEPPARPLRRQDLFCLGDVADPRLSPDGALVAYTVTRADADTDSRDSDVWLAPLAGGPPVRLTASKESDDNARFSPDGRWIAFLSERNAAAQVFLLNRSGGEAGQITDFPGGVSDLAWSPDSRRLAVVAADPDPHAAARRKTKSAEPDAPPKPLVIRRRQFKRDGDGYLGEARKHIHVVDVATRQAQQVTSGPYDDLEPAWSPDGRHIAFSSNRTLPDPDATQDTDVFVVEAREGSVPRAVTTSPGADTSPVFGPDGSWIAYVAGADPADLWYGTARLALVSPNGMSHRPLTAALDRNVLSPRFSSDGRAVYFLLEDGGNQHLARVSVEGGTVERVVAGEREVQAFDLGPAGEVVVLETSHQRPPEVSRLGSDGALVSVTHVNDAVLAGFRLGEVKRIRATSGDGTSVEAFLTLPPEAPSGSKLPAILWLHGGPALQFSSAFDFRRQLLAAHGYAVVAPNPRGSTGYGTAFSRAIWADWGSKDLQDVIAALDEVIAMGIADPDRLGVGGWSYGGILTNYVITGTSRFRAAISGASEANYLANYGADHYQYEWEMELGLPWKATELWLRLSPWFRVENISTPTLILCGDADVNVPLLNSEQLYLALRRLGKAATELVIYPGETHDIERPSFEDDRLERYVAWFDRFVKGPAAGAEAEATSLLGQRLIAPKLDDTRRQRLEADLERAREGVAREPGSADAWIWLGRRTAYLGRYREALAVYSRALARHGRDPRLLRHRGHRYLTVRELDKAVADLEQAARLVRARPDEVEPDGIPNAKNTPTSTLKFNVFYHLGLAHYLKGDFPKALRAYRECLTTSRESPDRLVAASDWLYLTLRRLGRKKEADEVLAAVPGDLEVIENHAYRNRLLFYKGALGAKDLLRAGGGPVGEPTHAYAVGALALIDGDVEGAKEIFTRIAGSPEWASFAVIAAEAELARLSRAARNAGSGTQPDGRTR